MVNIDDLQPCSSWDIFNLLWYLYIPVPVAEGITLLIKPRHYLLAIMRMRQNLPWHPQQW
jgi:hypothetical protein